MIVSFLISLVMAVDPVGSETQLERQDRQDTIYVLRGEKGALEAFHRDVGRQWTGGSVIDDQPSDGVLTYWAYSDRTAAQSRELMMPAIFAGFDMSFEEYEEAKQFPVERSKLDLVAVKCGVKNDPFFVTPKRSVELTMPNNATPELSKCLIDGARLDVQLPLLSSQKSKETN